MFAASTVVVGDPVPVEAASAVLAGALPTGVDGTVGVAPARAVVGDGSPATVVGPPDGLVAVEGVVAEGVVLGGIDPAAVAAA